MENEETLGETADLARHYTGPTNLWKETKQEEGLLPQLVAVLIWSIQNLRLDQLR